MTPFARVALPVVACLALLVAGCSSPSSDKVVVKEELRAQPTSAKVTRQDVVGYQLMDGTLYVPPTAEGIVRAPFDSPVQEVRVKIGDRVEKGQLLVKMAQPNQETFYAQSKANLKAAETAYANAKSTYEAPLREAERQLAQARSTERTLRNSGNTIELEQAVQDRQTAEEAVIQAKSNVAGNIFEYKQQLDTARIAYQQAKSSERQTNVVAPISGTVLELSAEAGKETTGGTRLARIVDLGDLQVKANLTSAESGVVVEDKPVVITFVGLEDKPIDGVISDIQTVPATSNEVKRLVTIDFKNESALVKPGMEVKSVGVKIGQVHDVLAIPADAVFRDNEGRTCARVMENKNWVVKIIETGLSDGFVTEVKSGLKEGDEVRIPGAE
jgi:multidrug efflux pump subunit AcrA (membrane-fusion protein)